MGCSYEGQAALWLLGRFEAIALPENLTGIASSHPGATVTQNTGVSAWAMPGLGDAPFCPLPINFALASWALGHVTIPEELGRSKRAHRRWGLYNAICSTTFLPIFESPHVKFCSDEALHLLRQTS